MTDGQECSERCKAQFLLELECGRRFPRLIFPLGWQAAEQKERREARLAEEQADDINRVG